MYRNQYRSERFDAHIATTRRPSRGCGAHQWVVCGGRGSATRAAGPHLPSNRSGRPGSLQRYKPKSLASVAPQWKSTNCDPVGSATDTDPVSRASLGSSESMRPANAHVHISYTDNSDALTSESAEEATKGVADSSTPTRPTKGYSSTAFTLQFGTLSPGVINKQYTPCTTTAPPDLDGKKPEQAHHGLSEKPHIMPLSTVQEQQKQEATNDFVIGGQTDLDDKHENVYVTISSNSSVVPVPVPALHSTPVLNSIPSPGKVCTDSCKVLPRTPSFATQHQQQQKQEVEKDVVNASQSATQHQQQQKQEVQTDVVNASQLDTICMYPATKPKISVHTPASYTPIVPQPSFVLPLSGMSLPVAFQQKQPQVPVEFRGRSMQMQSVGSVPGFLPVKMAVTMGNAPHIQPFFVHGAQPRALQQQAFVHQGQGLGCLPPASHYLPRFGNTKMTPELSQQQPKNGDAHKRTVKITHPETHEELMLYRRGHSYMDVTASGKIPLHNINQLPEPSAAFPPLHKAPRHSFDLSNSGLPITSVKPPMQNPWCGANSRPVRPPTNLHVASAPVEGAVKPTALPAEKNEVSSQTSMPTCIAETSTLLRYSSESVLPCQPRDCKIGLENSPEPAKLASEGSYEVPAATPDISCTTSLQTVSTQQAQAGPALATHVTPVAGSVSVSANNLPSACMANWTSSARVIPIGTEESPIPATGLSSDAKCELSQIVPLQSEALPDDGTSLADRNSKYAGDSILGKPPLLHTQEMPLPKLAASIKSAEGFSIAKLYPVSLPEKLSEVNNSVALEIQDVMRKEHNVNAKVMCSRSKKEQADVTMPAATHGVENCSVGKSVRFPACPESGDLHSYVSVSDFPSSDKNRQPSSIDAQSGNSESDNSPNGGALESSGMLQDAALVSDSIGPQRKRELESITRELSNPCSAAAALMVQTENPVLESNKAKTTRGRRKKRKEILSKADAQKSSSLYNVSNALNENFANLSTPESFGSSLTVNVKQHYASDIEKDILVNESDNQGRTGVFTWKDVAEISTEKLGVHESKHPISGAELNKDKYGYARRKYSQGFLLTFAQSCINLPGGFKIGFDIADAVMSIIVGAPFIAYSEYCPNNGKIKDQVSVTSRVDRQMTSKVDGDRWKKSYPGSSRSLSQNQSSSQYAGEILSRAMKEAVSQHSMARSSIDERWKRGTNAQGVSLHSQIPMPIIHKAEQKYEVGKVSDEEEAKQRQLKAILNKLTPQNFEKLFAQVKELNIDNVVTLSGVISQIFDKALMEPTFCEMYASFCFCLAGELPNFVEDDEKITFKRLLLTKCQAEFERGEREQAEADKAEEEGGIRQSEEGREEKRLQARRRMLGNIRLIGELYRKKMLTERIMHECIKKLLGEYQNPDEEDLEALCKLMSTIGEMIDHPRAKVHMDAYFDIIQKLLTNPNLASRIRFMLEDTIDLRKNMWKQRRKVEGPKKIEEVHRDAVKQKLGQTTRLGSCNYNSYVTSSSSAVRPGPLSDYGIHRSSTLACRGSSRVCAYGAHYVNLEDRYQPSTRALPTHLYQRNTDKSIRVGPQGELVRGMPICGKPPVLNAILPEVSSNNHHGQASHYSKEGSFTGSAVNRGTFKASTATPMYQSWGTADHPIPGLLTAVHPVGKVQASSTGSQGETRTFPEEILQEKSILTIREFYSAKDEKEVAMCMKELNAPAFYPSLVSLWINDSFERKDIERELLAKLLVYLCKSQENILSQSQLLQGCQYVLSTLGDAVTDAPKATEFLGRILARIILEDVISPRDIGILLQDGEEPGHVLEHWLASEVLGSMLRSIRLEKGDSAVNEIRARSNLRWEDFRRPGVCA